MSLIMGRDKIKAIGSFFSAFIRKWCCILILVLILLLPTKAVIDVLSAVLGKLGFSRFSTLFLIAIEIIGIFINVFAIVAIARYPKARRAAGPFIINLCLADLMFYSGNLFFATTNFTDEDWMYKTIAYITIPFLRYFNMELTLLTGAALAINRCILVENPALHKKLYQTFYVVITLAWLWLLSFAMIAPPMFSNWECSRYSPESFICSPTGIAGGFADLCIKFMIPCLVIAVSYGRICWEIRKCHTRILSRSMSSVTVSDHENAGAKILEKDIGITRILLYLLISFFVCCLPTVVIQAVDPDREMPKMHTAGYLLLYFRACVNPLIYAIANKHYRKAYGSILHW